VVFYKRTFSEQTLIASKFLNTLQIINRRKNKKTKTSLKSVLLDRSYTIEVSFNKAKLFNRVWSWY